MSTAKKASAFGGAADSSVNQFHTTRLASHGADVVNCSGNCAGSPAAVNASTASRADVEWCACVSRSSGEKRVTMTSG
jgi:hypothetical protein